MLNLTKQQLDERWDVMPVNLKEIFCSPDYGKIIWNISESNHLTSEKIGKIIGLVGCVVMGFIHPEDLPREIKEKLNLHYDIANSIYQEINKKIFVPIRSEIDKIYSPVGVLTEESAPSAVVEKKESIIDLRILEKQKFEEEIKKPIEIEKEIIEKQVEVKKELPAVPFPIEMISKAISKIEAAPVIIHKEIETKPTLGKQRSLGGLFGFLKTQKEGEKIQEQKPITAEVEMPIIEAPKPPKVVHYSDLKTSVIKSTTSNLQPTTIKVPEAPLPPKPEIKSGSAPLTTSKVFESEIEKAKAAGLIVNNQPQVADSPVGESLQGRQPITSNQQFKIEEIPIEIEEIPTQSFFSRIFQFLTGLFVTKKKIIREVLEQKENSIFKITQEKNNDEVKKEISVSFPPMPPKVEESKEFKFPIEIKLPEPPKKELELPKAEIPEIKEKPQPIMSQPEELKKHNEEVIDLRTFQKVKISE